MVMTCILWNGRVDRDGYGKTRTGGLAHRQAWEDAFGPIPEGLQIHHGCGNKGCVNLDHLEMLTATAHRRKHREQYSTCPYGHPYSGVRIKPNGIRRLCRTCNIEAGQRFRERARSK